MRFKSLFKFIIISLFQASAFASVDEAFIVKSITVKGNKRASEAAILDRVTIHKGDRILKADYSKLIHSLYGTGLFSDIKILQENGNLIIEVKERPLIRKLNITGVSKPKEILDICKKFQIAENRVYDPYKFTQAKIELERYYLAKGRYNVRVEEKIIPDDMNTISLDLNIYEGTEAKISKISIIGNKAFREEVLLKQLKLGKSNLFSFFTANDKYFKDKLIADLENLRAYYMDRGYLNVTAESSRVELTRDKKRIYITITINEGDKYNFGSVAIKTDLDSKLNNKVESMILAKIKEDATFSRRLIVDLQKEIKDYLGENGFSNAKVNVGDEINEEQKKIKLHFFIEKQSRILVRRINFLGNTLTKDEVLRRNVEQYENAWINTVAIQDVRESLLRDGNVGEVEIESVPVDGVSDQVDVNYKVKESSNARKFGAGLGWSPQEKVSYQLEAALKNVFGTGNDVDFMFKHSRIGENYSVSYTNPYFTDSGIGINYKGYISNENLSRTVDIFDYATKTKGASVSLMYPYGKYSTVIGTLGLDKTRVKFHSSLVPQEMLNFTHRHGFANSEYILGLEYRYNSTDHWLFPTKGLEHSSQVRFMLPGSSVKYYRLDDTTNYYYPIGDSYVWSVSGAFGYASTYSSRDIYPFYRNYFIGGMDSIRGFEDSSLGPKDSLGNVFGGNFLVNFRTAFIFPVPFYKDVKAVRMSIFLDGGQVYDVHHPHMNVNNKRVSRNPIGLRYSTGLSVTWNTPFGAPLVVSVAKALNAKADDKKDTVAFTFGTGFSL